MQVLIVESNPDLGWLWKRHIDRMCEGATVVGDQHEAVAALERTAFGVIVLDLVLKDGSAIAVADYAAYRRPEAQVVFVTNSTFFSDGSIFQHIANARAFLPAATPPEDLAAVVQHYGKAD
ncbi:MAG: response regulator transcription factor [Defluviimonas sp.]|uniref:hypothetical protein n=1 Tax=Albidovulum sp. TaxID=1872424 RepID=UPI001D2A6901|nr:response regulator transcription factor [Paracoccaceae bacterium]MCC0063185.1 response regulator transcription factor [Defluviimonas sp.]